MPDIAVLTGDIVRSSALAPAELDAAMAALAAAADSAAAWAGTTARFTRFRGDGWQCLAPAPAVAVRTALFLRAGLRREGRRFDTRIAIGIGAGDLPGHDLSAASGPAFRIAGHGLDRMSRPARMAIGWSDPPADAQRTEAILALCDAIARRWTPAQCGALAHALAPQDITQAEIAERLHVAQQTVARHLNAAGAWAVTQALLALEPP